MLTVLGTQITQENRDRRNRELEQLVVQTGRGDREAFALLYGRAGGAVYALALSLLHDAHEAQDVAQNNNGEGLKAFEAIKAYHTPTGKDKPSYPKVKAWFLKIYPEYKETA